MNRMVVGAPLRKDGLFKMKKMSEINNKDCVGKKKGGNHLVTPPSREHSSPFFMWNELGLSDRCPSPRNDGANRNAATCGSGSTFHCGFNQFVHIVYMTLIRQSLRYLANQRVKTISANVAISCQSLFILTS